MSADTVLKAALLITDGRVTHLTGTTYNVRGLGGHYVVDVHRGDESLAACTCSAGRRGQRCSHALAARYVHDGLDQLAVPTFTGPGGLS